MDLVEEVSASAFVLITESGESFEAVRRHNPGIKTIVATPSVELFDEIYTQVRKTLKLSYRSKNILNTLEHALVLSLDRGYLKEGDRVVVLCSSPEMEAGSIFLYNVNRETLDLTLYQFLRRVDINPEVFETVLEIAIEIGREGREGRIIGTGFIIGDEEEVLSNTKQIILNPFVGHRDEERLILLPDIKETVKELAQLDGVFVVNKYGVIHSAGTYLNVDTSDIDIPRGLGARHAAVAALTSKIDCLGVTVSQSGGIIRVFKDGNVTLTIEPQKRVYISRE